MSILNHLVLIIICIPSGSIIVNLSVQSLSCIRLNLLLISRQESVKLSDQTYKVPFSLIMANASTGGTMWCPLHQKIPCLRTVSLSIWLIILLLHQIIPIHIISRLTYFPLISHFTKSLTLTLTLTYGLPILSNILPTTSVVT